MSVKVTVEFHRGWGLWQVVASDHWGARIYLETPDEGKARAGALKIETQDAQTLDDVRALWDGLGPWDGVDG